MTRYHIHSARLFYLNYYWIKDSINKDITNHKLRDSIKSTALIHHGSPAILYIVVRSSSTNAVAEREKFCVQAFARTLEWVVKCGFENRGSAHEISTHYIRTEQMQPHGLSYCTA